MSAADRPSAHREAVSLSVRNLSKFFKIYRNSGDRLKEWFRLGRSPRHEKFWALQDVSLTLRQGECLGIVGVNGSGKSTLLKILAGTMEASAGDVEVNGRCYALLELGTGFNPDVSGRDNITLAASMLGVKPEWVAKRVDDIIEFSGLGEFIDRPLRTYSSGMMVRLGFSIFAFIDPDILIIDEALSVGDVAFQLKCIRRMEDLIYQDQRSAIIISHDTNALERFCDRVIWLDQGRVRMEGEPSEVVNAYIMANSTGALSEHEQAISVPAQTPPGVRLPVSDAAALFLSDQAEIVQLWAEDKAGGWIVSASSDQEFTLCYQARLHVELTGPVFGIRMVNGRGDVVVSTNTFLEGLDDATFHPGDEVMLRWPIRAGLMPGHYFVSCGISKREDPHDFLVRHLDAYHFTIQGEARGSGFVTISGKPVISR
ncbi:ABC transporter ATP-binding protein [Paramagnetospirillum magneticum]|uniref:ABC-type polysaccharide/polyol phosphate transport system n=1 Tax=Paramagnetospirillum magneticum (strain ATCC 700264 / AMB-1) TaxID=342108 RepID=Q2W8F9_PARM1|nr:ABC transporter ATP-binding protein [Paramagnetospirillum magneticum]BAE49866.1 ABC-type polysaccharide/polyol phosphate transport system [Paramagnetospirillum magneticum AMB-1]